MWNNIHRFIAWLPMALSAMYASLMGILSAVAQSGIPQAKTILSNQVIMLAAIWRAPYLIAWAVGLIVIWLTAFLYSQLRTKGDNSMSIKKNSPVISNIKLPTSPFTSYGNSFVEDDEFTKEKKSSFSYDAKGSNGVFSHNIIVGYDEVQVSDSGNNNLIRQNSFSKQEPSPWSLPKLPDGSSDLWRISHIISAILEEWKTKTGKSYCDEADLMLDARQFINETLKSRGEDWQVDDDLQQRLGYGK